jgi:hypothetical protein
VQAKHQYNSSNTREKNTTDLISLNDKTNNKFMHILVFQLQQLEYLFDSFYKFNHSNLSNIINCKNLIKASNSFSLRSINFFLISILMIEIL